MPRAKPKPGDTFNVTRRIGDGPLAVAEGTKVTVREVVAAKDPGAHNHDQDSVVVEFEQDGATRAFSIALDDADDLLATGRG